MRRKVAGALLTCSVVLWGVWFGGQFFNEAMVIPRRFASPPESVRAYDTLAVKGGLPFFLLNPFFFLCALAAAVAAWKFARASRKWLALSAATAFAVCLSLVVYLAPLIHAVIDHAVAGDWPAAEIVARVEAAAYKGRPVYFELLGPWSEPSRAPAQEPYAERNAFFAIIFAVFMLISVTGVALARRNWRLGRGDRRGAFRIAVVIFSFSMVGWLFGTSHVKTFRGELRLFWFAIAQALIEAVVIWLFYIALEPYVRRRAPHRVISWSRLVAGNWRDPLVGRDVLLGLIIGLGGSALTTYGGELITRRLGMPGDVVIDGTLTTQLTAGGILWTFVGWQFFMSLLHGLGYVLLLFLFSLAFRREWMAATGLWLLFMLPQFLTREPSLVGVLLNGLTWGVIVLVTARLGCSR